MSRTPFKLLLVGLVALAGCVTPSDQTEGSVTVDGQTYRTYTTVVQQNGTERLAKTVVLVAGLRPSCNPGIAGNCENAVREALTRTGRPSENPTTSHSYYALPPF
jgi:hypothetical protein